MTVAFNIAAALSRAARGGPCQVFVNDVKVRVGKSKSYYPDVVVVCGPVDMTGGVVHTPRRVVEVLSPSTRTVDQREEVAAYRQIDAPDEISEAAGIA